MKAVILNIIMGACVALQACTTSANPVYGNIGYEGATLYTDATGKTLAGELQFGEIVEWDDNQKTAYVKVRNIATGAEGYVDTLAINRAQYPLEAPEVLEQEPDECFLLNIDATETSETTDGWAFWKDGDRVRALNSISSADISGRMFAQQSYYIGQAYPGYILLTETVEYGEEKGEKLQQPIVIYEDIASRAGIFQGGKCFTPGGQLGGFDTDEWE